MNAVEKMVKDGKVAVLISPGFGAGWSTWADKEVKQTALFHPRLVQAALDDVKCIDNVAEEIFGDKDFYTGGWEDIRVVWVDQGATFRVDEYDGAESIQFDEDIELFVA